MRKRKNEIQKEGNSSSVLIFIISTAAIIAAGIYFFSINEAELQKEQKAPELYVTTYAGLQQHLCAETEKRFLLIGSSGSIYYINK